MNFYISSRLNNAAQVSYVASRLQDKGWTHTCDWTSFVPPAQDHLQGLQKIAETESDGVKAADIVLVLAPQGRGTHIELGMALALGKRVYLYHADDSFFKEDDTTCAFYWLPQVKQLAGGIDAAIDTIIAENTSPGQ